MAIRVCQFLAIIFTALAFVPVGFVVQQIYRGWALAGVVIFAAIFANVASALVARHNPRQFWLSLAAALLIAATLAIFFAWTYPANQATGNWTSTPMDWERLRTEWEYSHALNALVTFGALLCSVAAALSYHPPRQLGPADA